MYFLYLKKTIPSYLKPSIYIVVEKRGNSGRSLHETTRFANIGDASKATF